MYVSFSSFVRRLRGTHGASFSEYAILLGLLGATAASLVLAFSGNLTSIFNSSTNLLQDVVAYAFVQGDPRVQLSAGLLDNARATFPYTFDLNSHAQMEGFLGGNGQPAWTVMPGGDGLPPGLTLDLSTGIISGTPTTPDIYAFVVGLSRGESFDSQAFLLVVEP